MIDYLKKNADVSDPRSKKEMGLGSRKGTRKGRAGSRKESKEVQERVRSNVREVRKVNHQKKEVLSCLLKGRLFIPVCRSTRHSPPFGPGQIFHARTV